jgi:hypothetical protein
MKDLHDVVYEFELKKPIQLAGLPRAMLHDLAYDFRSFKG